MDEAGYTPHQAWALHVSLAEAVQIWRMCRFGNSQTQSNAHSTWHSRELTQASRVPAGLQTEAILHLLQLFNRLNSEGFPLKACSEYIPNTTSDGADLQTRTHPMHVHLMINYTLI